MNGVLVFLTILAALSAAPSPDPQYTISWSHGTSSDKRAGQGTWGNWGWNKDSKREDGRREDGRREDGRREDRREDVWKDGEKKAEEIEKEDERRSEGPRGSVLEEDHQRDSKFPRTIGRQRLGYQKRNFRSLAMRFPITPEILQPIGYRDTIKDLYFVPLNNYN